MILWDFCKQPKIRIHTDIGWIALTDAECISGQDPGTRVPARTVYGWCHEALDPTWQGNVPMLAAARRWAESPAEALDALLRTYPDLKLRTGDWGRRWAPDLKKADERARKRLADGNRRMLAHAKRLL